MNTTNTTLHQAWTSGAVLAGACLIALIIVLLERKPK